mmetsp:Transcript_96607/g.249790  ORF Transcript_96607/g.249790 Transcript_96607/m.249790 type:complete len:222 (-) Transcript_96607:60-725(-)
MFHWHVPPDLREVVREPVPRRLGTVALVAIGPRIRRGVLRRQPKVPGRLAPCRDAREKEGGHVKRAVADVVCLNGEHCRRDALEVEGLGETPTFAHVFDVALHVLAVVIHTVNDVVRCEAAGHHLWAVVLWLAFDDHGLRGIGVAVHDNAETVVFVRAKPHLIIVLAGQDAAEEREAPLRRHAPARLIEAVLVPAKWCNALIPAKGPHVALRVGWRQPEGP